MVGWPGSVRPIQKEHPGNPGCSFAMFTIALLNVLAVFSQIFQAAAVKQGDILTVYSN